MIPAHHQKAIREKRKAYQVKDIERPGDRRVGLQKFPDETLDGIGADEKIKALTKNERILPRDFAQVNREEGKHGEGLVELDGMAGDPIAKVDTPRKRCPYSIGVVRKAREEAAPATDGDAERQRRNELRASRAAYPGEELECFDSDYPPGDCSRNR